VTFDGDTHWLRHFPPAQPDGCGDEIVTTVEAGDTLAHLLAAVSRHECPPDATQERTP